MREERALWAAAFVSRGTDFVIIEEGRSGMERVGVMGDGELIWEVCLVRERCVSIDFRGVL